MTRAQGKHREFSLNQSVATLFLNKRPKCDYSAENYYLQNTMTLKKYQMSLILTERCDNIGSIC